MHVKSSIAAAIGIAGLVSAAPLERRQSNYGTNNYEPQSYQKDSSRGGGGFGDMLSDPLSSVGNVV